MPVDADALERLHRLRSLGLRRGARELARPEPKRAGVAVEGLPGEPVETPYGPAWLRVVHYRLAEYPDLAALLALPMQAFAALAQDDALAAITPAQFAFLDTETTGLSTGTDTYTFLIGIGSYEPGAIVGDGASADGAFVVRQFFMRNPAEERAQLHLVEETLAGCAGLVTFNGRAFDVPLVHNRFVLSRIPLPLFSLPHLDLLPPARRVFRAHVGSCALSNLEQTVLNRQRSTEDVPGWLIPSIYRDYYRGGQNVELISRVFYHNLEDITSMVRLAAHMAGFFEEAQIGQRLAALHPLECASLARCYYGLEWREAGEAAYRQALAGPLAEASRLEILRDLGTMLKRQGRRVEAAAVWEEWISSIPDAEVTPYVELAKHHEWHTGDLAAARSWVGWAIHVAENEQPGMISRQELAELHHRLERLERKLQTRELRGTRGNPGRWKIPEAGQITVTLNEDTAA